MLDSLSRGLSKAEAGRHFGGNESSIRTIHKCEAASRASVASGGDTSAKVSFMPHDTNIVKMESPNIWIEDQGQKSVPLCTQWIRQKGKRIYTHLWRPWNS